MCQDMIRDVAMIQLYVISILSQSSELYRKSTMIGLTPEEVKSRNKYFASKVCQQVKNVFVREPTEKGALPWVCSAALQALGIGRAGSWTMFS